MNDLRYPIGKFEFPGSYIPSERQELISEIAKLPLLVRTAVDQLNETQLETPYRPEGWTVKQVVHHLGDSHLNGFVRIKLALTEDNPTIKPYQEDKWVRLADTQKTPLQIALLLLEIIHQKWVYILQSLTDDDYKRTFIHPESGQTNLDGLLGLYAWHGKHHLAHITTLKERMGW